MLKHQQMNPKNYSDPFLNVLPSIDVHGYTSDTVYVVVSDFLNDSLKLGHKKVLIIHGVGKQILRKEIMWRFHKDKRINKIYIAPGNLGCTIIELK